MSQLNVDKIVSLAGGGGTARIDLESSGNFSFDSGTLYIDAGNNRIGINDSSPSYGLDINATDAVKVPVGTTAQRPATAVEGLFRYNSTDRTFEGYSLNASTNVVEWGPIAGSGGGGFPDQSADRYSTDYSVGATLKSDGTNTYWAFDAGDNDWSSARIWTHGYVAGGYKNSSAWRTVNRTVHSTDVTTNIGDIIDRSGGYFSGSWNDITHFCHSFDNSFRASSNYTSAYNMATESGRTHQGSWDMTVNRNSMGSFQDHVFAGGNSYLYGGGNSRTDVMNLKTEVMRTSGFPPDHYDGGDDPTWGGHGRLKGWKKRGDTWSRQGFWWNTETWCSWAHAPGGDGWKKIMSTMIGHMYVGTGNNNQNGMQKNDDTTGISTRGLDFGRTGEENYQMGMRKGYMLGNYNGSQNNNTYKVNYNTDQYNNLGGTTEPKGHGGMSSAHCASASSVTSQAASYDYGTNIPNY
mgnify:FL=1|tara:strand:- start:478 stop:1869 length:1392 start_codon:yes stop_codon:yes gene_type:complete